MSDDGPKGQKCLFQFFKVVPFWYFLYTLSTEICRVNVNLLLTEREGRTGEYWPEVVTVRTEHREVRTKTTEGQYSPVRLEQARLVSSLLYGTRLILCICFQTHFRSVKFKGLRCVMTRATQKELPRLWKEIYWTSSESFTTVTYGFHFWINWEPDWGDNIHHTLLSSATGLESQKSLASDRDLFWIRFHQSAKWLSLVLSTSAWPSLCASTLVFFSIFKLIVFSMLNENVFVALMKSEEVKKIRNCCCLVLFSIKFIELACTQMYLRK